MMNGVAEQLGSISAVLRLKYLAFLLFRVYGLTISFR